MVAKSHNTKRAHFIPEVYSKKFCIKGSSPQMGYLYTKADVNKPPIPVQPQDFGLKNYYYAFEKQDGTRDTQTGEKLFQIGEDSWPNLIDVFEKRLEPYPEDIDNLCTFLAMMRVRVPNFRMQLEERRAEQVRDTGMIMGRFNKALNEEHQRQVEEAQSKGDAKAEKALIQVKKDFDSGNVNIAIDPQESLRAVQQIEPLHDEFLKLNWAVFENTFEQDFVTTDNPVVYYDRALGKNFIPYKNGIAASGLEVIFPLTKRLMLIGNRFFEHRFRYGVFKDISKVEELNRHLILSCEKFVFSSQPNFGNIVAEYSGIVPRLKFIRFPGPKRITTFFECMLGPPHNLPRWTKDKTNMDIQKRTKK